MNITFIGIGVMGQPMAQNLQRCGAHQLTVFDIDSARSAALLESGARCAKSLGDAVGEADIVMTSLPGPRQIEQVAFADDGLFATIATDAVWIDLSTNHPELGKRIQQTARARGIDILDAPVTGGDEGARAGTLAILVGGETAVFERCRPVLEVIGERVTLVGGGGAGYAAKIAQVSLCYLHSLALSEAMLLGIKSGVGSKEMLDIIKNSTGRSYVAERYGAAMLDGSYDPSFTLELARKDIKLAQDLANSIGIKLPMCDLTVSTYTRALETYGGDANHLSVVRLLEQDNDASLQPSTSAKT